MNHWPARLLLLFLLTVGGVLRIYAQATPDETAVRQTVDTYLHGLKFNDIKSFKQAFHPAAKLFFVRKNGDLGQLTQEQWYQGFEKSAGKEEKGDLQIASVDVTGKAASVKVVEIYDDSTYTDYISLLKLADGWKIVNKIFVVEKRAE
jgi:hypothetical protein